MTWNSMLSFARTFRLTYKELQVLAALMEADGVITGDDLGAMMHPIMSRDSLHVHILRIRRKFETRGAEDPLRSARGISGGYWISPEDRMRLLTWDSTREAGRSALNAPPPGTERPVRGPNQSAAEAA